MKVYDIYQSLMFDLIHEEIILMICKLKKFYPIEELEINVCTYVDRIDYYSRYSICTYVYPYEYHHL